MPALASLHVSAIPSQAAGPARLPAAASAPALVTSAPGSRKMSVASAALCGPSPAASAFAAGPLMAVPRSQAGPIQGAQGARLVASATSAPATSAASVLEATENPLLARGSFPPFDQVEASHVAPGMKQVLAELEAELAALEADVAPTWEGLVAPLERLSDRLSFSWGLVQHLKAVKDSEALRQAVEEVQPGVVMLSLRFGQSRPLYEAFKAIKEGALWGSLSEAQRRIVDAELESAKASGVALEGAQKERFNAIQQELAELSRKFSNNVMDATKKWTKVITDPKEIQGLPATALSLAAQQAAANGHEGATAEEGPWLLTLDMPCYQPVMQHCTNRSLREEVYRAFITRASEGELDNSGIIARILALRKERAGLLGYASHAEGVMVSRMASLASATQLVEDIREAAWEASVKEMEELEAFAREQGAAEAQEGGLKHWDVGFWAERLREAKYDLTEEELRPYFALSPVLDGLFALTTKLFGVSIEKADGEAPVWHPDVQFFRVLDKSGQTVAHFYLDPYSRPAEKQGGAWMNPLVGRSRQLAPAGEAVRLPVAVLVCNQMMPVGDKPSLMTFREVETLFHEFGHGLQHMLTVQEESTVAGISNVEWDAVELPSQFMENWCYHRETLLGMAKHYETGETLPEDLFQKLLAARTFRAASMSMRQMFLAAIDLELHSSFDPSGAESPQGRYVAVWGRFIRDPPLAEDRYLNTFTHIFDGGYDCNIYGYKLHFASIDLELHSRFDPAAEGAAQAVLDVNAKVAERMLVMPPLPEDRFLCSFRHIFAGGYAAGYYGYKWAEVLSADAFSAFEEAGLDNDEAVAATGKRFRDTVLALGGGRAAKDVFEDFRGRQPSIEPLLRHNGLTPALA